MTRATIRFRTALAVRCRSLFVLLFVAFGISCDVSEPGLLDVAVEAEFDLTQADIFVVSGAGQTATADATLPEPVVIKVVDPAGDPIPAVDVLWVFENGGGAPYQPSHNAYVGTPELATQTGADGTVAVVWKLGQAAGPQRATATIVIPTGADQGVGSPAGASGKQGPKAKVGAHAGPGRAKVVTLSPAQSTLIVGDVMQIDAVVQDKWGNTIENPALAWSSSAPGIVSVDADGLARAQEVGEATVTASVSNAEGTAAASVIPIPRSIEIVQGDNQSGIVGEPVSVIPTVRIVDERNGAVEGLPVNWSVDSGGGSVTSSTSSTDASGVASMEWTLGGALGLQELTASVDDVGSVTFVVDAAPGPLASISVTPTGRTLSVGEEAQYQATATDAFGHALGGVSFEWNVSAPTVVQVDNVGLVTALAEGTSLVRASSAGVTGAASVVVTSVTSTLPVIGTTSLAGGTVGQAYSETLQATGGDETYTWAVTSGSLPAGLSLNGASGVISGTPGTAEASSFTVEVTSAGQTASQGLSITITASAVGAVGDLVVVSQTQTSITLQWTEVDDGTGNPASYAMRYGSPTISWGSAFGTEITVAGSAVGQTRQHTWAGLQADSDYQSRLVSYRGTLGVDAVFGPLSNVASGRTAASSTLPVIGTTSLAAGTVGQAYSETLQATGGDGTYTWAVTSGGLPAGLSLNGASGVISGTPGTAGVSSFTVQVTSAGQTDTQDLQILIVAPGNGTEPAYDPAVHALIDREDFDGFDAIAPENGSSPFTGKYPRGRAIYPGGPSNRDLQAAGTADRAEDDGIITITSGRGGGNAVRQRYGGADGGADLLIGPMKADLDAVGDLDGVLPEVAAPYERFFFSTWFRTNLGGDPAASNSSSVKGFMLWDNFPNRWEIRPARLRYGGTRWNAARIVPGGGYPENSQTGRDHHKTPDGYPPLWSDYSDGNWHRITIEYRGGNIPDSEKGWRMWLDGDLVFDNVGEVPVVSDFYGLGVGKDWTGSDFLGGMGYRHDRAIEGLSIWGNFVNGDAAAATPQFTIDYDDWVVWTIR